MTRYDSFIRAIEQAKERYESAVRTLIEDAAKQDASVDDFVRKLVKPKATTRKKYTKRKKLHWTQRPENKAKMLRQLKRATKAKQAQNGEA